ncbi:RND superfamily putative drug exporter [Kitasatospora sp. MAP12-15]|uniref:MMPL family transporter n=1 Tax=unclassified Kitasatospora TaxID=2633591 RepID=UPI0024765B1D|nr:MMPL family transporter [Kitasatospora sp. MAP12-44]MDH6109888.1 RND superfamily putative drug exporter [Kitasatospora sp. MAP12-44]
MFHRIGQFVVRRAWWVIAAWIVAAIAIVATAPTLTANTDESSFLPRHYESIQAADLQAKAFPAAFTPSAMLLFERTDGGNLDAADHATMEKVVQGLTDKKIKYVQTILPVGDRSVSKDGKYAISSIGFTKDAPQGPPTADTAKSLRDDAKAIAAGSDLKVQLGGPAAQQLDQQDSSKLANTLIGVGTVVIILLTLFLIFRSPLIALLPILSIVIYSMVANGLIADASKAFGLNADSSSSAILIVVLFGVGTDYFLFLMFRYRERLRAGDDRKTAVVNAVARVGEAIASAAGAVIVAFSVLILSSLGMFKALGPELAIAVFVTALASITLVPAVLSLLPERVLFRRTVMWLRWVPHFVVSIPKVRHFRLNPSYSDLPGSLIRRLWLVRRQFFAARPRKTFAEPWLVEPTGARFAVLGRTVQRRPGWAAVVSGGLLVVLALGAFSYKGTFDLASGSMPKTKESMVVQNTVMSEFSAGASAPSQVYLTSTNGTPLDPAAFPGYINTLSQVKGVAAVAPTPTVSKDKLTADFTVTLKDDPASNAAIDTIGGLRSAAHSAAPQGSEAYVGGITAVYKDINSAMAHDYSLVFPIAAVLIMLILGLLLRSAVAPWYLMAAVGLGFGATVGATSLVFLKFQSQQGIMFMLPMFIYLFVVAIGTDYNILMIARLREEAQEGHSPREAASLAIRHGGPTVAAAGGILAATFGTMCFAGNTLFSEIGFSVAFGIAVSAFVMAMFFTPALTALLGRKAWWPGHNTIEGHSAPVTAVGDYRYEDDVEPAGLR